MEPINIFLAISKYPYNPEHNPQENQHTAFFAYILNNDMKLLKYLLQKVLSNKCKLLQNLNGDDFTIGIQDSEDLDGEDMRPDMTIKTIYNNLTIYMENKIDSKEREGQLNDYLELAKRNSNQDKFGFVIYITKHYEDINPDTEEHQNFAGQFTWGMISEFIGEYINQSNSESSGKYDFTRQFIEYMEVYGLTGTKGFKKDYGEIWKDFIEFTDIKNEYLDQVETYFKNKGYIIPSERQNIYERMVRIFKPNWNNNNFDGFWINMFFGYDEDESSIELAVHLCLKKKFFDNVKSKFATNLNKGIKDLERIEFFKTEDKSPVIFEALIDLKAITKDYDLAKNDQIKNIIANLESAVTDLERSEFMKLLEENYPHLA